MAAKNLKKIDIRNLDKKQIGSLIQSQRKRKKYTQEQVAEAICISEKHYSTIESGKYLPSLQTFFNLLDVLELNLDDFSKSKVTQRPEEKDIAELVKGASDIDLELCLNLVKVVLNK